MAFGKNDIFGWLTAVRFNANDGTRRIWIIPRDAAIALSSLRPEGEYRLSYTKPGVQGFENNFILCPTGISSPSSPAATNSEDEETISDLVEPSTVSDAMNKAGGSAPTDAALGVGALVHAPLAVVPGIVAHNCPSQPVEGQVHARPMVKPVGDEPTLVPQLPT